MYTANHPRTRDSSQAMLVKIQEHLDSAQSIKISSSGDRLLMDGQPGDARSLHTVNLNKALAERNISGFQLDKGLELDELIGLLEVLILKPSKLDEAGGVEAVIAAKNMSHVRLSQLKYMEVGEDEEVIASSMAPPEGISGDERDRIKLFNLWLAKFKESIDIAAKAADGSLWRPHFQGELPPASLKGAGRLAIELKWETNPPPTVHWEAVQLALENLSAAEQMSIVAGRASLPDVPPSLNKVMDGFIPDILGKAAARLDSGGTDWKGLKETVYAAIVAKGDVSALYKAFGTHWLKSGKDPAPVSEIKNRLQWDYLPINEQLDSIEKPGFLWSLSEIQRNKLISHLLEQQMQDAFHGLLEKIISASGHGDANFRENAARTLEAIASSLDAGAISEADEELLIRSLFENFSREPDLHVLKINLFCLQQVITKSLQRSEFLRSAALLKELEPLCLTGPKDSPKRALLSSLREHLSGRENIEPVLQQYFQQDADHYNQDALSWLKALGQQTVDYLMELLADEKDRRRRGQIMDSIRSYGNDIIPDLVKSLASDKWYLVRNTLILIAEMADQACFPGVVNALKHTDQRVRRVAARTLWRGFSSQAAKPFLDVFQDADPETFEEILFGLAQIQAPDAKSVVLGYAMNPTMPERLRAMALNVLVNNPAPESLSVLTEFVKRKGRIITTAEPPEIRIAAAKALMAIGKEGRSRLQEIVKSEPSGSDREELTKILDS
jgi:hypothetical protein